MVLRGPLSALWSTSQLLSHTCFLMLLLHGSHCPFQLFFTGISLFLLLHLGLQCCLDASARLWCSRWSSNQTCAWRWALLWDFLCFHGGSLHRCTFLFGIVCRGFWHDNFYTKRVQSCSCALASQPPTTSPWELLKDCSSLTKHSGSTLRDVQLMAPFPVFFHSL